MLRPNPLKPLIAAFALAAAISPATADEVDHYAAEKAETLAEAVALFNDYNARLAALLAEPDLDVTGMEQVHEYTYTLEEALAQINAAMADLPATLEEVHLASEGDDPDALRAVAAPYLATALTLE
ncbi:MAG: DUF6746 family protein [Paracoccaceae bacterium]